ENLFTVGHPRGVVDIDMCEAAERGRREPPRFARSGHAPSERKPIKLTRVDTAATAEDQPAAIRRDRRVGVACRWERRVGQLPFLSAFYRNYEQGVRLAVARGICNNQTVALRTPGEVWRSDGVPAAHADLRQFALRPAQWRD